MTSNQQQDGGPRHYLNLTQFAEQLGMGARHEGEGSRGLQYRWKAGKLPWPDVCVGNVLAPMNWYPGWSAERVALYRDYAAPLCQRNGDGTTTIRPRLGDPARRPEWWGTEGGVQWFYSVKDIGIVLGGLKRLSVTARIRRGGFTLSPEVCVGGEIYGWDQLAVDEYARQERSHPRGVRELAAAA
jgi:hypothetical protein